MPAVGSHQLQVARCNAARSSLTRPPLKWSGGFVLWRLGVWPVARDSATDSGTRVVLIPWWWMLHIERVREILDRMGARPLPPAQVGRGGGVDPGVVGGVDKASLVPRESMRHGRSDSAESRLGLFCAHREIHPW